MTFNRLVYLAGPIDNVDKEKAMDWRERTSNIFSQYGFGCFSPAHAFINVEKVVHAKTVKSINDHVIGSCQFIFVMLNDEMTIGTIREIEYGSMIGLPIYLHSPLKSVISKLNKSLMTFDCTILNEPLLGDAIRLVVDAETDRYLKFMNYGKMNAPVESEETENGPQL